MSSGARSRARASRSSTKPVWRDLAPNGGSASFSILEGSHTLVKGNVRGTTATSSTSCATRSSGPAEARGRRDMARCGQCGGAAQPTPRRAAARGAPRWPQQAGPASTRRLGRRRHLGGPAGLRRPAGGAEKFRRNDASRPGFRRFDPLKTFRQVVFYLGILSQIWPDLGYLGPMLRS